MQAQGDYIFHVEEPLEQPRAAAVRLRGWVAARQAISSVRLTSSEGRSLARVERPDVQAAFPNLAFSYGFEGALRPEDLAAGDLHLEFVIGGKTIAATERLPAPPAPPGLFSLIEAKTRWLFQRLRLQLTRDPRRRWNAALAMFLLEIKMARGGVFRRQEADRMIALFAQHFPEAMVVQIGANDGATGDPLCEWFARTQWQGLFVEPMPHLCRALRERYRDVPRVRIEQAAVSDQDGEAPLYFLRDRPNETPAWYQQLATLNKEVLLKHRAGIPEFDQLLLEERVRTTRAETLLARHRIAQIDLLVIDTEGHDFVVLQQFDLSRYAPRLVMFEHQHLSVADKAAARALLQAHGYSYAETKEGDAIAWSRC